MLTMKQNGVQRIYSFATISDQKVNEMKENETSRLSDVDFYSFILFQFIKK